MSEARLIDRRHAIKISAAISAAGVLGGGLFFELLRRGRLHRLASTRSHLGTLVSLEVVHPDAEDAARIIETAFSEIERLEAVLSRYREGSAVHRLNTEGRVWRPPSELVQVVGAALDLSRLTDGAFDVTMAPLLRLYTDRPEGASLVPSGREIAHARGLVGYERLHVSTEEVSFGSAGMELTLDGIAKGFIVDRTVAAIVEAGAERVLVDAGGDVASGDMPPGAEPWTIGIQDPHDGSDLAAVVHLSGRAVATSGDYMQSFTQDRSAHHILDPRTGRSPPDVSGVSVVAPTAMEADALSTAVFVLGRDRGLDLLEHREGVEGLLISKDGQGSRTSGFHQRQTASPSRSAALP